jgi:hypothetical protein
MITQHTAAAHQWNEQRWTTGPATLTIDLPADRVMQDSTLIDHVIAMAFEQLAHGSVELRVREIAAVVYGSP